MSDRRPRASYGGARYPRPPGALSRRSALLRLGGIGGLILVGTSPWSGLIAARARARSGDEWTLFIPLEGNLRVLTQGDMMVAYRVTLLVTSSVVLDCIESDEWRVLESIDDYLRGLNEEELVDPGIRPEIEATVTDLIAGVCPLPPNPADDDSADDDSADDDSTPSGDEGSGGPGFTLLELEIGINYEDPDDFDDDGGIPGPAPPTFCTLPRC